MKKNVNNRVVLPSTRSLIARSVSTAIFASALSTSVAVAADTDEKIIITATKSNQSIQEAPVAITAVTGEFMDQVNLTDVKDLVAYTPGITGNSQDSFIDAISVRGIRTQDFGVGGDPSTAFFKNDLYEGRNGAVVSTLFDMDRAEILRGPQGFLFGRNSVAGAVSVHTRRAEIDDSTGTLEIDIAENNHLSATATVNVPVNDNFAMRFAAITSSADGFITNQYDGKDYGYHDKTAVRWSTTYETEDLKLYTSAEFEDRKLSGSLYRAVQEGDIWEAFDEAMGPIGTLRGGPGGLDSENSSGSADEAKVTNLGLKLEYDLGSVNLTANTGFKDHDYYYSEDYDGTPLHIADYQQDQKGDYFQQEVRINSKPDDGPLSWYAGASYYKENIDTRFNFVASEDAMCQYYSHYYYHYYYNAHAQFSCSDYYGSSGFTPSADGTLTESSRIIGEYSGWATYFNLAVKLSDQFDVEVGVRHTNDKKKFSNNVFEPESWLGPYWAYLFSTDGPITETRSWSNTSYRILGRWTPTEDMMLYASFTEGYKSGGFGSFTLRNAMDGGPGPDAGTTGIAMGDGFLPGIFEPETVDSYEFGYKDTWFDGNAKVDLTAFMYDYKDLQIVTYDVDGGGAAIVKNVGEVESQGLEGSIQTSLSENFDLYLSLAYLDSEANKLQDVCGLDDVDGCEGSTLFWAPEFSGGLVLNGDFPLDDGAAITASFEVFWESERGGGWENLSSTKIDSFNEVALRVGYQSADAWNVQLYVENLTDEFTWDGINNNGGIAPSHFFGPMRPRTIGLRFTTSWD